VIQTVNLTHILHEDHQDLDLSNLPSWCHVWKTCMRTIIFGEFQGHLVPNMNKAHVLTDAKAYAFLLEIICGLHSKMIGETEIIAQFKIFTKTSPHALCSSVSNKLLQDSKKIRHDFLKGNGERSYGSYIQKQTKGAKELHLLGCGQLGQVILPLLKKDQKAFVYTREPSKYNHLHQKYKNYTWPTFDCFSFDKKKPQVVVIAAPLSSSWLQEKLNHLPKGSHVIDLRSKAEGKSLSCPSNVRYDVLDGVMEHITKNQDRLLASVSVIKKEILKRATTRSLAPVQRPLGWEDVCA